MLNEDTIEQMLLSVLQKNGWTYIPAENMPEPPPTEIPKGNAQMFMANVCAGTIKRPRTRIM